MSDRESPFSREDFVEALGELLEHASDEGVAVESAWEYSDGDRRWDIQITRVRTGADD